MRQRYIPTFVLFLALALSSAAFAEEAEDPSLLTLERIYKSSEFKARSAPSMRWLSHRPGYTTFEDGKGPGGGDDQRLIDQEAAPLSRID